MRYIYNLRIREVDILHSSLIVWKYFKKHWPRYVIGIAIVFVSTYLNTMIPKQLGFAVDALNSSNIIITDVKRIALLLAVISVAAFLSRFIWRYLILGFCRHIEFYLRENLFAHLQKLSIDYYVKNNTGDIITRAIVDVQAVRMLLGFATAASIDAAVTTVMSLINMSISINIVFTLLAFVPIPFLIIVIIKVRLLVRKRYSKVQESISNLSSKVQENITGIRVMKAFSQEGKESEAFDVLSKKKLNAETKLARAFAVMSPSVSLTFGIVFSIFLVAGGSMVAKNKVSLGDFVSFNTYLVLIMTPIGNIGKIVDRWQRGVTSMKRIDKILLTKPTIDDSCADLKIESLKTGSIQAKDLCFSYETTFDVLKNLSFYVPSGGSIAIMGPTGCGKSTIIDLIMRLWNCDDGMLTIDGKDINSIPIRALRENCAYVPQDSFLFSDTIMENIRFYNKVISDEQVIAAAQAAYVHENIVDFPLGYNTVVGERGMTLSGGQKQRIALARALVTRPKILLLDDCMSAVDAETEKNIIQNLKIQIADCTAVVVTHRLSAALLADTVMLLNENGEVAEIGNHSKLIEAGGTYAKMVESMQLGDSLCKEDGDIDE